MDHPLHIVTGAPGSGKSTTLQGFLALRTPYLAFDIDWLAIPASDLAGKDIIFEPSTWPSYNALWLQVLGMININHQRPVFFAPTAPQDLAQHGLSCWYTRVEWLLLDCSDQVRRQRLAQRAEWTAPMIEEAIGDAAQLRQVVPVRIDTELHTADVVAHMVYAWLQHTSPRPN